MKKLFEKSTFPLTYPKTIQFLWDWYNHLKLNNLPQDILIYMRQFAFFDSRITHPRQSQNEKIVPPYQLIDLPQNSGLYRAGYSHAPFYNDPLNIYFQHYMTKIATKLYQANTDLLGEQPPFIFHLNPNKNDTYGAGIRSAQYPPHIAFPLDEIGTLYQTEDQLAGTLAHELVHLSIMQKSIYRILSRTEEALADLLGTLIIARAGYRPSQNILFMANQDKNVISLFQALQQNIIPTHLTPEEIICLAEVAEFNHIKIPKEKIHLFRNKGIAKCKDYHPHPATRMIYLNKINEYFHQIGLISTKDAFLEGQPIDTFLLKQVQKRQAPVVRKYPPCRHKKYSAYRIYPSEKSR